jgi:hypothetical protein
VDLPSYTWGVRGNLLRGHVGHVESHIFRERVEGRYLGK